MINKANAIMRKERAFDKKLPYLIAVPRNYQILEIGKIGSFQCRCQEARRNNIFN